MGWAKYDEDIREIIQERQYYKSSYTYERSDRYYTASASRYPSNGNYGYNASYAQNRTPYHSTHY